MVKRENRRSFRGDLPSSSRSPQVEQALLVTLVCVLLGTLIGISAVLGGGGRLGLEGTVDVLFGAFGGALGGLAASPVLLRGLRALTAHERGDDQPFGGNGGGDHRVAPRTARSV